MLVHTDLRTIGDTPQALLRMVLESEAPAARL